MNFAPLVRTGRRLRILLVKPRPRLELIHALHRFQFLEPIELGYLAAAVDSRHDVRVLDLRFFRSPLRRFRSVLASFGPDLVGITGYTHEAASVKELAAAVRAALPRTRTVVGGHHATVAPADYASAPVDAVVRGEGCAPFRRIVDAVAVGESLEGIEGVWVPDGSDDRAIEHWPEFPDPASMPVPRRDLWDPRRYYSVWPSERASLFQKLFASASMVRTSFGCRMRCTFCIVPKLFDGKHHVRPAEVVACEIAALPNDHVYFCDDENFIDAEFAHELASELEKRNVRKRYFAWTRSTTVNRHPDLFARWQKLGLDAAFLGFEFPTDEQLRKTRKGATVAENARAHTTLRSLGIAVHAAFMLLPEMDLDDFERLRTYIDEMPPAQFSITVCTPSPATDDYVAARPNMWVDDPYALHDCMHPLTPTKLPLRTFSRLYARQIHDAALKNPRRADRRPIHPLEIPRVAHAQYGYERAFARMYRDYPRELWGD